MKSLRLERWGLHCLFPLARPARRCPYFAQTPRYSIRWQTATAQAQAPLESETPGEPLKRKRGRPRKTPLVAPDDKPQDDEQIPQTQSDELTSAILEDSAEPSSLLNQVLDSASSNPLPESLTAERLPSPLISRASKSAKLSALHARLSLPSRLPIETLARALIHPTADSEPRFNNQALAVLGNDLLGYYTAEHLLCHYPRLPMAVVQAAQYAYVGPRALAHVAHSWGVEVAAEPGGEVDPGLLQFRRLAPGSQHGSFDASSPGTRWHQRATASLRLHAATTPSPSSPANRLLPLPSTTLEAATTSFIRALTAALYLHAGAHAAHAFFTQQLLRPRPLDLSTLFTFTQPTRDLSRLCAREGFAPPVARLEAESGRLSRHPVFVVGVYSGRDKLGEAAGASLNEARYGAAVRALKAWYLYAPPGELMVPSCMEGVAGGGGLYRAAVVDDGEVIV